MDIRELKESDIKEAMDVVLEVFSTFVAPVYSQQGIDEFRRYIDPEAIISKMRMGTLRLWGCCDDGRIVGVAAVSSFAIDIMRGPYWKGSHIYLLFVKEEYQRRGIARQLFEAAKQACAEAKEITVNSSPYAVEVYRHLGFIPAGNETNLNGIRFTPMKYINK